MTGTIFLWRCSVGIRSVGNLEIFWGRLQVWACLLPRLDARKAAFGVGRRRQPYARSELLSRHPVRRDGAATSVSYAKDSRHPRCCGVVRPLERPLPRAATGSNRPYAALRPDDASGISAATPVGAGCGSSLQFRPHCSHPDVGGRSDGPERGLCARYQRIRQGLAGC